MGRGTRPGWESRTNSGRAGRSACGKGKVEVARGRKWKGDMWAKVIMETEPQESIKWQSRYRVTYDEPTAIPCPVVDRPTDVQPTSLLSHLGPAANGIQGGAVPPAQSPALRTAHRPSTFWATSALGLEPGKGRVVQRYSSGTAGMRRQIPTSANSPCSSHPAVPLRDLWPKFHHRPPPSIHLPPPQSPPQPCRDSASSSFTSTVAVAAATVADEPDEAPSLTPAAGRMRAARRSRAERGPDGAVAGSAHPICLFCCVWFGHAD